MENKNILQKILPPLHFQALNTFVDQWSKNEDLVFMILTGSFVHGDASPNSDLDVFVILKNSIMWRKRGNTFIEGVEIEYFINPVKQIEYYLEDEYPSSKNTADMFCNSILLIEKIPGELERLRKLAKNAIDKPLPKPNDYELYMAKYNLDDQRKDLLDAVEEKDPFVFYLVYNQILSECQQIFLKFNQEYRNKPKRLKQYYPSIKNGKRFTELLSKSITEIMLNNSLERCYNSIHKLIMFTEDMIGGARPKEDYFESKVTY